MPSFSKYIAELELVQSQYFTDNGDGTIDVRGDGLEDQNGNAVSLGGGGFLSGDSNGKGYLNIVVDHTFPAVATLLNPVDLSTTCIEKLNSQFGINNWTYPVTVTFRFYSSSSGSTNAQRVVHNNHEVNDNIKYPTHLPYSPTNGYSGYSHWAQYRANEPWTLTVDNVTDWPITAMASGYVSCTIMHIAASEFGTYSAPGTGTLNSTVNTTTVGTTSSIQVPVDVSTECIAQLNSDHGVGNWTYPCTVNFTLTTTNTNSSSMRIVYNNHEVTANYYYPVNMPYSSSNGYSGYSHWGQSGSPESWTLTVDDVTDWPIVAITNTAVSCTVQSVTATPYP